MAAMKNPIVAAAVITAVLLLAILGVVQFVVGPSSAKNKEALINGHLANFTSAQGKISPEATTDDAFQGVCAGKGCSSVTVPPDYAPKGMTLSPCYHLVYDAPSNSFKVSFSLMRFITEKPYLASASAKM